jgi:hypothetical protein
MTVFNSYTCAESLPKKIACQPLDDEWRQQLACYWWSPNYVYQRTSEQAALYRLAKHLVNFSGHVTCMQHDEPDLDELLSIGYFVYGEGAALKLGQPKVAHKNAALLWREDSQRYVIVTGYGLSQDGMWRQHSWCYDKHLKKIIETTYLRVAYYGFDLGAVASADFFLGNTSSD